MKRVPNAITISRIVVTPILIAFLFWDTLLGQAAALGLFVFAAISDYFDGQMARRLGAQSRLGRFLDPMADKILVLGTLVALAIKSPHLVPWWAVALIALRDVTVTLMRMRAEHAGRSLRTIPMAKTKTTVQLVFLIGVLVMLTAGHITGILADAAVWILQSPIPFVFLMGVVAITVFTGLWYLFNKDYVSPAQFNP